MSVHLRDCPNDGERMMSRPSIVGYAAEFTCDKCHQTWVMNDEGIIGQAFPQNPLPEFLRKQFDTIFADVTASLPKIEASSSGAAKQNEQLETDLRAIAERVEGPIRKDIAKAADEARAAAEQGRYAVQAVGIFQTKLVALEQSIRDAGLARVAIEVADLRRLLYEHVEHHAPLPRKPRRQDAAARKGRTR